MITDSDILTPLSLPYAFAEPTSSADYRVHAEDFIVEEIPNYEPTGDGEHVLLQIQKRHSNTHWVAKQLAKLAGIKLLDVGFAGLKDRHALTTQCFSVRLAGKDEPDWSAIEDENINILQKVRHQRKVKRGALKANRFTITLRNIDGDKADIEARLEKIKSQGVPNYFGEQRFGIDNNNLASALKLFRGDIVVKDKSKRGFYLSAARSHLFNQVLAERVRLGIWNNAILGDVFMLEGTHSIFTTEKIDPAIQARIKDQDIHPSAPLWGTGESLSSEDALELETQALTSLNEFKHGLEQAGLNQERRATRLLVSELSWTFESPTVATLNFTLGPGSYATTVLREVCL